MATARRVKEISFSLPNRVGLLSEITTAIAGVKVNITAICAYAMENTACFMLATDNNPKAKKALAPLRTGIEEKEVAEVEMSNKAGELEKVAKKIADAGIDIQYMYGTAAVGRTATCIFHTADNKKAIRVINK